jgi:hypothetical protein
MTEEEAIEIAKRTAKQEGWAWIDPAYARLRRRWFRPGGQWRIYSNRLMKGPKVRVFIDDETGEVLEKGYIPR